MRVMPALSVDSSRCTYTCVTATEECPASAATSVNGTCRGGTGYKAYRNVAQELMK